MKRSIGVVGFQRAHSSEVVLNTHTNAGAIDTEGHKTRHQVSRGYNILRIRSGDTTIRSDDDDWVAAMKGDSSEVHVETCWYALVRLFDHPKIAEHDCGEVGKFNSVSSGDIGITRTSDAKSNRADITKLRQSSGGVAFNNEGLDDE